MDEFIIPDPIIVESMAVTERPEGLTIRGRVSDRMDAVIVEYRGPFQTHLDVRIEFFQTPRSLQGQTTLFSTMYAKGTRLTVDLIRKILDQHADEGHVILPAQ